MAATTRQAAPRGQQINTGDKASVITAAETNQLSIATGKVAQVVVWDVGTTATLDIYDNASASSGKVWGWVSADGKGTFAIQMPIQNGLRVVSGGTFGGATIVWSS